MICVFTYRSLERKTMTRVFSTRFFEFKISQYILYRQIFDIQIYFQIQNDYICGKNNYCASLCQGK
jgi:hypothetical protein